MAIESRNYDTVFSPQTFRSSLMLSLVIRYIRAVSRVRLPQT